MSRIAIDIRPLTDRHMTGVGFALLEALRAILPHASPTREYILFATGTGRLLNTFPTFPKTLMYTLFVEQYRISLFCFGRL